MKNKKIVSVIVAAILTISMVTPVFASSISYTSKGGFTITIDSLGTLTTSDLFGPEFKELMPGDHVEKKIHIDNKYPGAYSVKLYMKAVPHDAANLPEAAVPEGKTLGDIPTMEDFLEQLSMKIYKGNTLIFEASPEKTAQLTDYISIGYYANTSPGTDLTVILDVPIDLDERYANRVGEVDWQFKVEETNPGPGPDPKPDPKPVPGPKPTPTEPARPAPETAVIPKTGDTSNLILWIVLMAASASALLGLLLSRKKK